MVKVTGKWPLTLFSAGDVRGTLDVCPLCHSQSVGVQHVLCNCPATQAEYNEWSLIGHTDNSGFMRTDWERLRMELFADRLSHPDSRQEKGEARILFVGRCVQRTCEALLQKQETEQIAELIQLAEQTSSSNWRSKRRPACEA